MTINLESYGKNKLRTNSAIISVNKQAPITAVAENVGAVVFDQ